MAVHGGFVHVEAEGGVTVLPPSAELAEHIDVERARRSLEDAESKLAELAAAGRTPSDQEGEHSRPTSRSRKPRRRRSGQRFASRWPAPEPASARSPPLASRVLDLMIRPARPADAEDERAIERAAGDRFAEIGMPHVAGHEPMSADMLIGYAVDGRSWVATDAGDRAVGYVVVDVVDGCAHIEQVSVHPSDQGKGLGRALVARVERWAADEGLPAVTLTTFKDVPWNRPLYEHLGFSVLADDELSAELLQIRDEEARRGLDPTTRVCMRKPVLPAP